MAQQSFSFIAGLRGTSTSDAAGKKIYFINPTNGVEYRTVDLSGFNFNSNNYVGTNGYAYSATTNRIYFTTTLTTTGKQGDGGLHYYDLTDNTAGTILSNLGTDSNNPANAITADNASINGNFYYFTQDQVTDSTPDFYRIDLSTTATVQAYQNWNGASNRRYYDFGDIAIGADKTLYGSAATTTSATNPVFFTSAAVANYTNGGSGTGIGYSDVSTTGISQLAFGWKDSATLNGTLYGQGSDAVGGGTNNFYVIDQSTGTAGAALFTGARGYSDLTSAPLAPTPAPPGVVSGLIGIVMGGAQFGMIRFRKRRRAAKDAGNNSTISVSE